VTKKAAPSGAPAPDPITVNAIRAVFRGTASPGQQKRAMVYLLNDLGGVTAIEGAGLSAEERAFVAGRRWVAMNFAMLGGARLIGFDPEPDAAPETAR